jgi:hypothetical protein
VNWAIYFVVLRLTVRDRSIYCGGLGYRACDWVLDYVVL